MKRYVTVTFVLIMATVFLAGTISAAGEGNKPIIPKEKTMLWNGKDFAGWKMFLRESAADPAKTWSVTNGLIRCEGKPAGYMRTEKDYADYLIHVEWRWPEKAGNNGVLVHMSGEDKVWPRSLECQLHSGNAGDFWVIDGLEFAEHDKGGPRVKGRRTIKLKDSSERPPGQWNTYDIVCKDDWIVVFVNGVLQNVGTKLSDKSGKICLQSEGAVIEYRNISVEPLE
jgi:hypothetical protein